MFLTQIQFARHVNKIAVTRVDSIKYFATILFGVHFQLIGKTEIEYQTM